MELIAGIAAILGISAFFGLGPKDLFSEAVKIFALLFCLVVILSLCYKAAVHFDIGFWSALGIGLFFVWLIGTLIWSAIGYDSLGEILFQQGFAVGVISVILALIAGGLYLLFIFFKWLLPDVGQ